MPEARAVVEIPRPATVRAPTTPQADPVIAPVSLGACCLAEAAGTFLLVLFGLGAVHAAVFTDAQVGLWQVAVAWGIGVALAIHATGAVSGAHLNPAITLALGLSRRFAWRRAPAYVLAQVLGAFLAAAALHALFAADIATFEASKGITRGGPGSELSAMAYGEYFPNPAVALAAEAAGRIDVLGAFATEALATAVLAFVVLRLTDPRNAAAPGAALLPWTIGLCVAGLISFAAPLTQACFNPARDFGPRVFAWLAGWGEVAIPGPRGGFLCVYVLGPLAGGALGAFAFSCTTRAWLRVHR